ncbi:hypothetical protein HPB51_003360 [Rhipicephalus microplus]|uniref:Endonuclease/exonuclease/phosphatase domain-containing protein n=1 Tax=Rhipicephalus microplus TaxID=6941 RepID=A0A9J6D3S0_RHIMP|nr:hypothetical protein HPB51_003360 [Rhipicephalus microplus]
MRDFNARHPDWGNLQANKRGKKQWQLSQDLCLTLLNHLQQSSTRIGKSVLKDTPLDLAYYKNSAQARWENTCQLAGSDHYIISIQLCNGINGQLGNKKTWHLLLHLLDPDDSKTAARHILKRLVDQHPGSDEDLLTDLADIYINQADQPATPLPPYEGKRNPTLDADITEAEVDTVILKLRATSAPSLDGISN